MLILEKIQAEAIAVQKKSVTLSLSQYRDNGVIELSSVSQILAKFDVIREDNVNSTTLLVCIQPLVATCITYGVGYCFAHGD